MTGAVATRMLTMIVAQKSTKICRGQLRMREFLNKHIELTTCV